MYKLIGIGDAHNFVYGWVTGVQLHRQDEKYVRNQNQPLTGEFNVSQKKTFLARCLPVLPLCLTGYLFAAGSGGQAELVRVF